MKLAGLLKPSALEIRESWARVNAFYNRVIMAVGYPRTIREGWLDALITAPGNYDLSITINPGDIGDTLTRLNRELVKQKSDMLAAQAKGIVNPSLQIQHDDTLRTLQQLQSGEEKLFEVSLYVNARATNQQELDLLTKRIESTLNAILIVPKIPCYRMGDALRSVMPLAQDKLGTTRNMPTNALSACFPFTTAYLQPDQQGVLYGVHVKNRVPIIIDPYKLPNYNGLVLGTSGSGKSFFTKLLILRHFAQGTSTYIIDPQGEYAEMVTEKKGQLVEIHKDSKTIINPLDLMGRDFGDKLISLMELFKTMFGDLTESQKSILDKALYATYEKKGILPKDKRTWKLRPPILSNLYDALQEDMRHAHKNEISSYEALQNRLRTYVKGSYSFLNQHTKLDFAKKLICFDISKTPNQLKPTIMHLLLEYVTQKTKSDHKRKNLIIDEAWMLLRSGEQANYLYEIAKTARKHALAFTLITQEAADLLDSKAGNTILANTSWKFVLRQEPSVIQELTQVLNLNQAEQSQLLTATQGQGILYTPNQKTPLQVIASPQEEELITTNPDALRQKEEAQKRQNAEEEMDDVVYGLKRKIFFKNELSELHENFLLEHEYVVGRMPGFDRGRGEIIYMPKPPQSQSPQHYFMCCLIYDEVRKYTEDVVMYNTTDADIVFVSPNQGKIAIEVETGTVLRAGLLEKKVSLLNERYKQWYFVVLDSRKRKAYEMFGPVLLRTQISEKIKEKFT